MRRGRCYRLGCSSPPPVFITLSNNWLVFLDRGKSTFKAEGKRGEQPRGSVSSGGHRHRGGSGTGSPARGRCPEPCACRWGHYVLFVFLFLGWENKQGSGFSAVSLQLTNRAHHSAGVAHSVRGDGAGTERGASLNLREAGRR